MTYEQWLEQVTIECNAIGAVVASMTFLKVCFSGGMTPQATAQFFKSKQQ